MSLLWIDGFEGYGQTPGAAPAPAGVMARRYSAVGTESGIDIENGRVDGYCIQCSATSHYFYTPGLNTANTLTVGVAVNFSTTASDPFLCFYDGGTKCITLSWQTGGELAVGLGADVDALGVTTGLGLMTGAWYYLELQALIDNAAGAFDLHVGGVSVLSDTGIDTKEGTHDYCDVVKLISPSGVDILFDDFYVLNNSGSVNNDFLGNVHVLAIFPDGDGTSSDWTPNTGNNFECVDDITADGDTTYVESNTANHVDLYTYDDLASSMNIKGIQINTDCRDTDANTYTIITEIRSGGNTYDDAGQALGTTSYVTKRYISEADPNTSNSWVYTDINSAEFGIKVA